MKNFSMPSARTNLRAAIKAIQPPAVDYIDWTTFEDDLDTLFANKSEPSTAALVKAVFARAVTRARQAYAGAVKAGEAWKQ
jgi:hypothetical protein